MKNKKQLTQTEVNEMLDKHKTYVEYLNEEKKKNPNSKLNEYIYGYDERNKSIQAIIPEQIFNMKADFSNTILNNITIDTDDYNNIMTGINFENAELHNCKFKQNKIENCNFKKAKLNNCKFDYDTLQLCDFDYTKLNNCEFGDSNTKHSYMEDIEFTVAKLNNCKFNNEKMDTCTYIAANIKNCTFNTNIYGPVTFFDSKINDTEFNNGKPDKHCSRSLDFFNAKIKDIKFNNISFFNGIDPFSNLKSDPDDEYQRTDCELTNVTFTDCHFIYPEFDPKFSNYKANNITLNNCKYTDYKKIEKYYVTLFATYPKHNIIPDTIINPASETDKIIAAAKGSKIPPKPKTSPAVNNINTADKQKSNNDDQFQ